MDFPIYKTKKEPYKAFDLTDVNARKEYFEYKAGPEIKKVKDYLAKNTFVAYLLGKKSSGKGTYAKMFAEVIGQDTIAHFSIGDMIRDFDKVIQIPEKKQELVHFLKSQYRGFLPLEEIIKSLEERSTKKLLPSELILALAKREISKIGKKAIFIDGFPRDLDQISYSLFFRDLIGYRDDPDIFILIDVPNAVIDERVKCRVVCPVCHTSRSLKLLPTKHVIYKEKDRAFALLCDNQSCSSLASGKPAEMVAKEGDVLGIAPIKERLEKDGMLIKKAFELHGMPKILLRNSVPATMALEFFDDYELTPEYFFEKQGEQITVQKKLWEIKDDEGVASYSLTPPPVVVALIQQLANLIDNF